MDRDWNNSFGYENIYGYYLNKELAGLYIGYTGEKKKYYEGMPDLRAFLKAFNVLKILILTIKLPILNRLLTSKLENDEYYLSNLVVDSKFRGRGIGSILLDHAIENAKKEECTSVILDADMNNKKIISFYKRIGFKIVGKNEIKIMKEGTYKMALNL
ncbi:MAG: GNAT family N-acetyltransferase [Methanomicrobia archaeon]|nr:GNAT family N-acetyltransferase [Methanomicrobia archaeon]